MKFDYNKFFDRFWEIAATIIILTVTIAFVVRVFIIDLFSDIF